MQARWFAAPGHSERLKIASEQTRQLRWREWVDDGSACGPCCGWPQPLAVTQRSGATALRVPA